MLHVSSHSTNTASNLFAGTADYVYSFGGNTIASGNLVVIFVGNNVRTVSSITGTNLTSMVALVQSNPQHPASSDRGALWYGISTGSVTSVTITLSGATSDNACVAYGEFSGEAADQSGATSNSALPSGTTTHASGSVTPPTASNVVVVGGFRSNGTWTEDGAFTLVSTADANCLFAYLLQSSATAQEFNSTSDANEDSVLCIGALAGEATGRTTKNTRSAPLGMNIGMGWRM